MWPYVSYPWYFWKPINKTPERGHGIVRSMLPENADYPSLRDSAK